MNITTDTKVFSYDEQLLLSRTISNRPLITEEEQLTLYSANIAIIGLSVGSQAALTIVRSGIGSHFFLVDPDTIELKNLNRTPFFLQDVGKKKVKALSEQLHLVDPHLQYQLFDHILTPSELEMIVEKADLIVDAFDDFQQKVLLREYAKKYQKPLVTGFDIDRGAMVIVERYDLGAVDNRFFYNQLSPESLLKPTTNSTEKIDTFISLIGEENHSAAMLEAVKNVGKKHAGIPQLMIATNILSASWTVVIIDVLLKKQQLSLRRYIDLETLIYG